MKNLLMIAVLTAAQLTLLVGLSYAQEKRWKEINSVNNLPDGLWPLKAYQYQSNGLFPGEYFTATIVEDRRHMAKTGKTDLAIVLQATIDMDLTFPKTRILQLGDWGFCSIIKDECEKYIWITETLMTALSTDANEFSWRGSHLSITAHCYADMESAANKTNTEACYSNPKALSTIGIAYLDDFIARWKSDTTNPRRLTLRFFDSEKENQFVRVVADDLYEKVLDFANSR